VSRAPAPTLTIRALQMGAAFAISLLLAAIALHALGYDIAERAAFLGVVALIATPALSLAATFVESRTRERPTALLATAVLAVLAVATVVALLLSNQQLGN